ncbi:peptidylprolyl isomerase [Cohnella nanjingensis]|uniref:peptidylprolyl isomerase n=1 Tax=Cohnella nanjingensis TaxID=1387779 RepID=UPI0035E435CC
MIHVNRKTVAMLILIFAIAIVAAGCGKRNMNDTPAASAPQASPSASPGPNPVVTIEMDSGKKITLELFPQVAPNTVNNFISLVKKGFYDGLGFHRVIPNFMIQGGDPDGRGSGGPGYAIKGEFEANGFKNDLLHKRGVISMARAQSNDTAGSQFFIMVAENATLDGKYAAFGIVTSGIETVDEIVNVETDAQDKPVKMPIMKKVTVDTKGVNYPEPEKVS